MSFKVFTILVELKVIIIWKV